MAKETMISKIMTIVIAGLIVAFGGALAKSFMDIRELQVKQETYPLVIEQKFNLIQNSLNNLDTKVDEIKKMVRRKHR